MKRKKKTVKLSDVIEEVHFNDSHIKKLYHNYIHQTFFDKLLDILVFFAIIFTIMGLVMEYLINISDSVLHFIHSFSVIILVIFMVELLREYAKAKTKKHFFKKHWIDVLLIVVLSFYFLFVTYLGFAKAKGLTVVNKYAKEAKHLRVALSIFKK